MNMPEVVVIDYGLGNLLSVQRALEHCGAKVILTSDPKKILSASHVVLPGVGAFFNAMQALDDLGLVVVIRKLTQIKTPLLGICLGMQLLLEESSEFGLTSGLGLIPGRVIALPDKTLLGVTQKIPHIAWSAIQPSYAEMTWQHTLLQDNIPGEAVYFIHSFMAVPSNPKHCIAKCFYGGHKIAAVISQGQITGCQFHPEKSGKIGLKILLRFILQ